MSVALLQSDVGHVVELNRDGKHTLLRTTPFKIARSAFVLFHF